MSDAEGGPFRLRVLRPAGGTSYTGAGTSGPETPANLGLQTFATNLPIQAGDTIGLNNSAAADRLGLAAGLPGATYLYWDPPLPDGSTLAAPAFPNEELAFNADVQPPPSVSSINPASPG